MEGITWGSPWFRPGCIHCRVPLLFSLPALRQKRRAAHNFSAFLTDFAEGYPMVSEKTNSAMSSVYAMQRANGDWFALEDHGSLRVPVFSSNREAMQARAFNVEMLVFRAVLLDERALKDLAPNNGEPAATFWLVNPPSRNMKRGVLLTHAQLAVRVRGVDAQSHLEN